MPTNRQHRIRCLWGFEMASAVPLGQSIVSTLIDFVGGGAFSAGRNPPTVDKELSLTAGALQDLLWHMAERMGYFFRQGKGWGEANTLIKKMAGDTWQNQSTISMRTAQKRDGIARGKSPLTALLLALVLNVVAGEGCVAPQKVQEVKLGWGGRRGGRGLRHCGGQASLPGNGALGNLRAGTVLTAR